MDDPRWISKDERVELQEMSLTDTERQLLDHAEAADEIISKLKDQKAELMSSLLGKLKQFDECVALGEHIATGRIVSAVKKAGHIMGDQFNLDHALSAIEHREDV